jgi:hypothetical protein
VTAAATRNSARPAAPTDGRTPRTTDSPPRTRRAPDDRGPRRREAVELRVTGHRLEVQEVVETHEREDAAEQDASEEERDVGACRLEHHRPSVVAVVRESIQPCRGSVT